jgi:hypothetical protein
MFYISDLAKLLILLRLEVTQSDRLPTTLYIYKVGGLVLQGMFYISDLAKLLILLRLEVTQSDRPWEAVRPPGGLMQDRLQGTPVKPP